MVFLTAEIAKDAEFFLLGNPGKMVFKFHWASRFTQIISFFCVVIKHRFLLNYDAHVKSSFYMDLGIKGFRNYELFKLVIRILNWRIL